MKATSRGPASGYIFRSRHQRRALERLRIMFGDPLLVRVDGKMELTLFAMELRAPLKHLLISISDTVKRPAFDPASASRPFASA
jgi:DNA-binding transcriptional LysR family regulator